MNIKASAKSYAAKTVTHGLIAQRIVEETYTQGSTDVLREMERYFNNIMPPFYRRELKTLSEKLQKDL